MESDKNVSFSCQTFLLTLTLNLTLSYPAGIRNSFWEARRMNFSSPYSTKYLIDSIITLFIRFHFRVTDPSSLFILVRFCSTGVSGILKRVFQVIDTKTVTLSQCENVSLILSEKPQNNVKRHLNRSTCTHNLIQTYIKRSYDFLNVILISCLWANLGHVSIWVVLVHPWINLFIPEPL